MVVLLAQFKSEAKKSNIGEVRKNPCLFNKDSRFLTYVHQNPMDVISMAFRSKYPQNGRPTFAKHLIINHL